MKLIAFVLAAAVVSAAADKPTPRQKARELLDSAAGMIAATQPDVQVAALYHLADNYQAFDKKKSIEYFKQAFTTAGVPPASANGTFARSMQMEIVVSLAALDTAEGVALLKLIPAPASGYDNRSFAAARVIGKLVEKGQLDIAIELAEYMGGAGAYPFEGAGQIMAKLPVDDSRRTVIFSQALSAYTVKPSSSFARLLTRYYRDLPPGMPQTALSRILNVVLSTKVDDRYEPMTIASAHGTVTFTNRVEADLFEVMPLVREIEPKRYEELLAQHTEVRSALGIFPGGGPAIASDRGVWVYTVSGGDRRSAEALNERQKLSALIENRAMAALETAAKDADKGLDLVASIPSPPKQAEVLGRIAEIVGGRDSATAKRVLSKCVSLLDDVKYPDDRVAAWDIVAGAAAAGQGRCAGPAGGREVAGRCGDPLQGGRQCRSAQSRVAGKLAFHAGLPPRGDPRHQTLRRRCGGAVGQGHRSGPECSGAPHHGTGAAGTALRQPAQLRGAPTRSADAVGEAPPLTESAAVPTP